MITDESAANDVEGIGRGILGANLQMYIGSGLRKATKSSFRMGNVKTRFESEVFWI
jgi:hypothetical protein